MVPSSSAHVEPVGKLGDELYFADISLLCKWEITSKGGGKQKVVADADCVKIMSAHID